MMKKYFMILAIMAAGFTSPAYAIEGDVFVDVNGLVCDFCARALEKVFGKQEAVASIDVNLDNKVVTIDFKDGQSLDDETIAKLITDAGYNVVEIRHEHHEQEEGESHE